MRGSIRIGYTNLRLGTASRRPHAQWQEDCRRQGWRINARARRLATQRCSVCVVAQTFLRFAVILIEGACPRARRYQRCIFAIREIQKG